MKDYKRENPVGGASAKTSPNESLLYKTFHVSLSTFKNIYHIFQKKYLFVCRKYYLPLVVPTRLHLY